MAFNPSKYMSQRYNSSSGGSKNIFTIKGKSSSEDIILSEEELVQILGRLKDSSHVPLKKMSGSLKTDFEIINKYIGLTHNTNSYPLLLDLIRDQFISEKNSPDPGTIGAFFRGSNLKIDFDPVECSALGVGAIPNGDESWKSCKNTVILAVNNRHGYDFSLLKMGDDPSHAYIHVNHDSYEDFQGFNSEERRKLKRYNVEYVFLHGYENDATKQHDLVGNAIHIDEIKHRKCNNCGVDNSNGSENSSSFGWAILIFFVIIIIILLLIELMW